METAFCHNDLLAGNIVIDPTDEKGASFEQKETVTEFVSDRQPFLLTWNTELTIFVALTLPITGTNSRVQLRRFGVLFFFLYHRLLQA